MHCPGALQNACYFTVSCQTVDKVYTKNALVFPLAFCSDWYKANPQRLLLLSIINAAMQIGISENPGIYYKDVGSLYC